MPLKQIKIQVPPSLNAPVLVDEHGIPRYWSNVWIVLFGQHLAVSSLVKKLRHIELLYTFADQQQAPGKLDQALASVDMDVIGAILEGYFVSLQNTVRVTQSTETQWKTGFRFVESILAGLVKADVEEPSLQVHTS